MTPKTGLEKTIVVLYGLIDQAKEVDDQVLADLLIEAVREALHLLEARENMVRNLKDQERNEQDGNKSG